ncbi:MAG: hypothetical protein K2Y14_13620, partial [Burkholderiales bacterium]|nr:hypothetical protein [Burkholderiales bacterium]
MPKLSILMMSIAFLSMTLSACNDGVQSNNAQQTADAAATVVNSVQATNEQFIKNTCLSGVFNTNGSLSLTNSCSSAQSLAQANLKFVSQDSSGDALALDKFYNQDSGLRVEFSSAGSNQQIGSFASVDKGLVIDGGQTLVFSGPINQVDQDSFDSIQANKTLELISLGGAISNNNLSTANLPTTQNVEVNEQSNGKSLLAVAAVKLGSLALKINTAKAGCGTWTNCDNLTAQVNDSAGSAVGSITVPAASFGKTYSATIPNLAPGNYTVTLSNVGNTTVVSSNAAPVIKAGVTTTDTVTYTTTMGSAKVTVVTSAAACGVGANCSGLSVSLVNPIDGTSVASFKVPESAFGKS